jgi:hypothetical protein
MDRIHSGIVNPERELRYFLPKPPSTAVTYEPQSLFASLQIYINFHLIRITL